MDENIMECQNMQKEQAREIRDLNTVIDKVADGITLSDNAGHFEIFNARMREITGYTIEEANSQRDFAELLYPDPKERRIALERLNEVMAKRIFGEIEITIQAKDGSRKTLLVSTSLIEYKNLAMFLSIYHDITARKAVEEALRDSEEKCRTLVENVNVGVYRVTADPQGRFLQANPAVVKMFGYDSVPDFLTTRVMELYFDPEDRKIFLEEIISYGFVKDRELRLKRKDGALVYASVSASASYDTDGNIRWIDAVIADITERRQNEELLRANEERYRKIIQTSIDGFWFVDLKGNILDVNESYCKMTGYSREELMQMNATDIEVMESPQEITRRIQRIIRLGRDRFECRHKCKDGRIIEVEISTNYIEIKGESLFFTFIRDITERKWLEKELEELALKDSHTGLFNSRYLKEAIEPSLSRAKRQFNPFSVIMMDIDYFKSINDVYGHIFGDLVLRQFATQIKKIVRPYDIVIRYGGEEFIIVCSEINRTDTLSLAHRILEKINLYNFGDRKHVIKLKLSLAVASYPEDDINKGMDLVKLADQILGKVKESGGNRVYSSLDLKKERETASKKTGVAFLKQKIDKLTSRANQSLIEAIFAFAKTIELKDHYTGEHVERSVRYASRIAQQMNLPKEKIEQIRQGAILHDLGKIGISEKILRKKSKLDKKEFSEIKKHPLIGAEIIRPIQSLHPVIPLMLYHHERWDGKGYPQGLKKETIPLGARIIAIADAYQALVSERPYRKAYLKEKAIKIIEEGAGSQFDPNIVKLFLKVLQQEK